MAYPKSLGYLSSIYHFDWYNYVISSTCLSVLRDQFTNLAQEFPGYFMAFTQNIADFLNNARINEYLDKINLNYDAMVKNFTTDMVETVKDTAANLAQGVASGITGFVSALTGIVLSLVTVPFILFYLLKDGEKLPSFILKCARHVCVKKYTKFSMTWTSKLVPIFKGKF